PAGAGGAGATPAAAGTKPLTPAPAGASLQSLADQAGVGGDWQDIARANGIENPRLLLPGQLIDLNLR
ncbi:MAG TPA: LysM domain-containing protein, partial [Lacunisphaera sp.]|nr:LysM domain-containing protein [Lacunisphaera sp.]